MTEELTYEQIKDRMDRNWMSWQMEESADRNYDKKMCDFYRDRYYYYKKLLEDQT